MSAGVQRTRRAGGGALPQAGGEASRTLEQQAMQESKARSWVAHCMWMPLHAIYWRAHRYTCSRLSCQRLPSRRLQAVPPRPK